MQHILVLGAGKSATVLIEYLLQKAPVHQWQVTVGDLDLQLAQQKVAGHAHGKAVYFNADEEALVAQLIGATDVVVSLLPAFVHPKIAERCVAMGKHFVSASYVSEAMQALHAQAVEKGIVLLNEIGLDPGIDHMSAMQLIDAIKAKGGVIESFKSYTGGLIAPESDTNPWNYKFTWNPRNVVLAGQGTAKYLSDHKYKYIPYHQLFSHYLSMEVPCYGIFEGYPNRDSLSYRSVYGLEDTGTIIRGTLRKGGFCRAWDVFVQLGMTDDSYTMEGAQHFTWADYTEAFLPEGAGTVRERLQRYLGVEDAVVMDKLAWLGLFDAEPIFPSGTARAHTPAQLLQILLESKWSLEPHDKDMCVMLHVMEYVLHGKRYRCQSSMVAIGDDAVHTAMAKTVGLPAALAVERLLTGKLNRTGVVTPVTSDLYIPILQELADVHGIVFHEDTVPLT